MLLDVPWVGGILMVARGWASLSLSVAFLACTGCTGAIEDPAKQLPFVASPGAVVGVVSGAAGAAASTGAAGALGLGANGITRLSREEYRATLRSLLGVDVASDIELLPADSFTPFDKVAGTKVSPTRARTWSR